MIRPVIGFILAHIISALCFIASWTVLGHAAFAGAVTGSVILTWAALFAASSAASVAVTSLGGVVVRRAGVRLRRRLLDATLQLDRDTTRGADGIGVSFGRVLEAEAVSDLTAAGALFAITASVQLVLCVAILVDGPYRWTGLTLLGWLVITGFFTWCYYKRRREWTDARFVLTRDLVDKTLGHRTRLAQLQPAHWHDGEECLLNVYRASAIRMDRWLIALKVVVTRGWLVVALIVVAAYHHRMDGAFASAIGAVVLATQSLELLVAATAALTDAAVAAVALRPILRAALPGSANALGRRPVSIEASNARLITVNDLRFESGSVRLVVENLRLASGDRVLLGGKAGSGKSMLLSLLAGLRPADSGDIVRTAAVAESTHFDDNYIVLGPLAFNLLLGRSWPPRADDLTEAYEVGAALGLAPLLARMPSGINQIVGETGWQLSQGERTRVYLARALLEHPGLLLLDGTLDALDPITLQRCLDESIERSRATLLVHA